MAGFQFMHSEVYAATAGQPRPAKKGGAVVRTEQRKLSAMAVIGEAARLDGCAPHVDQPQAPKTLFGIEAGSLANWCTDLLEMAANQVTVGGKKQRKDTPVLMGIVASFPGPPDDSDANYVRWKELNVSYFRQKFGDKVASILSTRTKNTAICTCFCTTMVCRSSRCIRAMRRPSRSDRRAAAKRLNPRRTRALASTGKTSIRSRWPCGAGWLESAQAGSV